jgi:cellulose synthase/poly-beta-1,6-N-acetylglucosamine synthase-like glycosyltransferase
MDVSIGIMAYNEEKNIGELLERLLNQKINKVHIKEIIVFSDGSTDRTNKIVKDFSKKHDIINLIEQKNREGKVSVINKFLKRAKSEILVMESADTIPAYTAIESLCSPLINNKIGITTARTIPVNKNKGFMRFLIDLNWKIHNKLSEVKPKFCELIAFRNVINFIPKTCVDEEYISAKIVEKGFIAKYVPSAVFYTKGPENLSEFVNQTRRNFWGHLELKKETGYKTSTIYHLRILKFLFKEITPNPLKLLYLFLSIGVEVYARILGLMDFYRGREHYMWNIARSTKCLE